MIDLGPTLLNDPRAPINKEAVSTAKFQKLQTT